MSRVGKLPIELPSAAKLTVGDDQIEIEGPKGKLSQPHLPGIQVKVEGTTVSVERSADSGPAKAKHGLVRALLANAVRGVTEGFKKELDVVGVGYRGEVQGQALNLSLGFSHPVVYPIPEGISIAIDKQNRITVEGIDKQRVGQVAAELRALRPPDAYKGKGIRYRDEVVRLKEGKSAG